MLQNYIKIALRNLWRNKAYFSINVLGLGIALACSIIAYLNFAFDRSFDRFHEQVDRIFRINMIQESNGRELGVVPLPLGPAAAREAGGVQRSVQALYRQVAVKREGLVLGEQVQFTTPGFFELFTFSLKAGSFEALQDKNKVLVSEGVAQRYFGEEPALGKELILYPGEPHQQSLLVGAVFEDPPLNSSLRFEVATHIDNLIEEGKPLDPADWSTFASLTFLELDKPADAAALAGQLEAQYLSLQNKHARRLKGSGYVLEPFTASAHRAREVGINYLRSSFPVPAVWGPIVMAMLLLLTACLNFTNTAISASNRRLKEMGMRKVMGGTKRQLALQLLSENFFICLLGLLAGLLLVELLLPPYNAMWPYLHLDAEYLTDWKLLGFMAFALLATGLLAGAYPAFYISSFRPAAIFRGKTKFGGSNLFTRILLGVQVMIALVAMLAGLNFMHNAAFQEEADLGYGRTGILGCAVDGKAEYERLRQRLQQHPKVEGIAGSEQHLGYHLLSREAEWKGQRYELAKLGVGEHYLELMGLEILEGRGFEEELATDDKALLINETLAAELSLDEPLGTQLRLDSTDYTVIGIVKDFMQSDFFMPIMPTAITRSAPEDYNYLLVRSRAPDMLALEEDMREAWAKLFPFQAFRSFFQDDVLAEDLRVTNNIKWIFLFLAIVTILLSMTGLFSIVSLNVLRRMKEIAIRRIFGAEPRHIAYLINKNYLWIFAGAALAGIAGGSFLSWKLLDGIFAIHAGLDTSGMIIAAVGMILVAVATIGIKVLGVLKANPADIIRSE